MWFSSPAVKAPLVENIPFGRGLALWHCRWAMNHMDVIAANLERLIKERGLSRRGLSLDAGLSETVVRDIVQKRIASPTYMTLVKLAKVLAVGVQDIVGDAHYAAPTVPVVGQIVEGGRIPSMEHEAAGPPPMVPCPALIPAQGTSAVNVVGNSVAPVYQAGHVLFFSQQDGVSDEDMGRPCVAVGTDGTAWLRLVQPGSVPGRYHLLSLNPMEANLFDQELRWAARVRLALPAELVLEAPND